MSFRHRFSGKRLFATILVSTLLIANVSHTQTGKITVPMEQGAYVVEVSFRPYGSIVLATIVREVNGKTAVCGFWEGRRQMASLHQKVASSLQSTRCRKSLYWQ